MEFDSSHVTPASEPSLLDSIREFVAYFVHYLELRLQLLGLESRETGFQLLLLALLFVSTVICFGGFVIMLVVFLLYLMMLTLHWEWGWSALAVAGCYWLSVLEWRSSSVSGSQSHCSQRPWPSFKRIVNG
jgi:uncharacterized membrane protein YqjE